MALTLCDLLEKLKQEDEVVLCELLHLRSEEIVDRFVDIIEERYDVLKGNYE